MIKIKKYFSCTTSYLLKIYIGIVALLSLLAYVKSCPAYPFNEMIWKEILAPSMIFFVISPLCGLFFTQKSMNACKFHLPYQYIKSIHIDEYQQKVTLIHNYNRFLCRRSKKDHESSFNFCNYNTTLLEFLECFPENIERVYDQVLSRSHLNARF